MGSVCYLFSRGGWFAHEWVRFVALLGLAVVLAGCEPPSPTVAGCVVSPSSELAPGDAVSIGLVLRCPDPSLVLDWSCKRGSVRASGALTSTYEATEPGPAGIEVRLIRRGQCLDAVQIPIEVKATVARPVLLVPGIAPLLRLDVVPEFGPGGEDEMQDIAGTVANVDPTACRIVVYSLAEGGVYYVQPFAGRPVTDILFDSTWSTKVHLGREYWIVLERADRPHPPAKLRLPPRKEEGVLVVLRVSSKGNSGFGGVPRRTGTTE